MSKKRAKEAEERVFQELLRDLKDRIAHGFSIEDGFNAQIKMIENLDGPLHIKDQLLAEAKGLHDRLVKALEEIE